MIKMVSAAIVLAAGILIYFLRATGEVRLGDACFIAGLIFCCIGLFRVVCVLGFFTLPMYGIKKLFESVQTRFGEDVESTLGDYADYQSSYSYDASVTEPLLTGGVLMAIGVLLMYL